MTNLNNVVSVHFDIPTSLLLCNPEDYYNQLTSTGFPLFPGVKYVKRVVLNRDRVTWDLDEQPRELDAGEARVHELTMSYKDRGILYNKAPQAIVVDPADSKRFRGRAGFGRNQAQEELGWKTAMYDILEFDTDLHEEAFKYASNDTSDHVPAFGNTEASIKKAIVNAVISKMIHNTKSAIMEYMQRIAPSKGSAHDKIYKRIRSEDISAYPTMKAMSTARAKKFAEKHNLPHSGDSNKETEDKGYVRKFTTIKNVLFDGMELSNKYHGEKVYLSTWIDFPKPKELPEQRKAVLQTFKDMKETLNVWISNYLDMNIEEVRTRGKGRFPIVFNGFIAQNMEKTPEKGGGPVEEGLVGVDGKPFARKDSGA